ncbi:MAG: PKD domain-containing protein, partial [Thermoplasmata archaeon]
NDNPHISFYDGRGGDRGGGLRYAKRDGNAWNVELVDQTTPGSLLLVGGWSSIVLDSYDYPHISYYDRKNESLKYTRWDGSAWNIEIVDAGSGATSIELDSHGNPHISYSNYTSQAIKYAKWNGSAWEIEIVNSSSHLLRYASMELDSNDNPHIGYYEDYPDRDLKFARKGGGIASYDWDFGDGSPHGNGVRPTHVYSTPGVYNITLTATDLQGATDTDYCIITVLPGNRPPVADANGPYYVDEGSPITLDGSNSYDPDGDALQYRWDLNNDGIWDTGWSSSPHLEYTWGDDHSGQVALQVSDGEFMDIDTTNITVRNVAPTVELRMLPISVNVSLRIAGEKWHDVSIELYEDYVLVAVGNLTRYPGSPNDQMLHLAGFEVNISRKYSAIVRYTPEDDSINGQPNGANPCWIILMFNDGEEVRLHHNFNVQHPDRYVWEADLSAAILSHGLKFEATAYDPGADDLTFHWDFGDGTNLTSFYPNGNKTFPLEITEIVTHIFPGSGTYTITLTVEDDDGGVAIATLTLLITV